MGGGLTPLVLFWQVKFKGVRGQGNAPCAMAVYSGVRRGSGGATMFWRQGRPCGRQRVAVFRLIFPLGGASVSSRGRISPSSRPSAGSSRLFIILCDTQRLKVLSERIVLKNNRGDWSSLEYDMGLLARAGRLFEEVMARKV